MGDTIITAKKLLDKNKEYNSSSFFWHYSSINHVQKIIEKQRFECRSISNMNDLNEAESYKAKSSNIYALCFSSAKQENIPMWYMYAGITGNGASIVFKHSYIFDMLEDIKMLTAIKGNKEYELKIGDDFDLYYGWIYYRENKDSNVFKYRNTRYEVCDDIQEFLEDNYFIKDYPWNYENEFRIVIKVKKEIIYEKIILKLPDIHVNKGCISIRLGPEMFKNENESEKSPLETCDLTIEKSKLSIKMNLLDRNKEDIIDNIDKIFDGENYSKACKYMRDNKYCKNNEGGND